MCTHGYREKPENHQLPVIHYKNEPRLLAKSSLSTPEASLFEASKEDLGKNLLSFRFRITTAELHLVHGSPPEKIGKQEICLSASLFPRSVAPPQKQESPGINYPLPFEWLREGKTPVGEITALRNINEISIKEAPV